MTEIEAIFSLSLSRCDAVPSRLKGITMALLLAGALAFLAGCAGPDNAGDTATGMDSRPVNLKLVSMYNNNAPIVGESIVNLVARVKEASGGNINFKIFEPGKLVAPMEVLDAVASGKVQAGYSAAGFWMGKMPSAPLFSSVPFGPDATEYLAWFFAGNGNSLYQEMYDQYGFNVKVFVCGIIPPETSGWFANEITSPDELSSLKMRFFGLGGAVMQKLGVSVNLLPPGEIFPALEKRVIDATEYSIPSLDEDQGFYKIVRYNYFPGWHQQASTLELLINKDAWEKLSTAQKSIIKLACQQTIVYSITRADASQAAVIERNARERGVKNMTWSPEMLALFREKWMEVAAEQSAADPFFKKVYDDYTQFRKNYAVWSSKAYLPRPGSTE